MEFSYKLIETQIIEVLPELQPAANVYEKLEGKPGDDCGPYIFFEDVIGAYVKILLNMPGSSGRDRLLKRVFNLLDDMLQSNDRDVRDLAYIGLLEGYGLWYYARALPFLDPVACSELDKWETNWREAYNFKAEIKPDEEIIDLYCVREVILNELESEGITRLDVPGNTYPNDSMMFDSLKAAKNGMEAVVYLGWDSHPLVICPPEMANCSEKTLFKLGNILAGFDGDIKHKKSDKFASFPRIPLGERVWQMNHGDRIHLRYGGKLWIKDSLFEKGLYYPVINVLNGIDPLDGSQHNFDVI